MIGWINDGFGYLNGTQTRRLMAGTVSGPLPPRGARSAGLDTVPAIKQTGKCRLATVRRLRPRRPGPGHPCRGVEATKTHIRSPRPGSFPLTAAPWSRYSGHLTWQARSFSYTGVFQPPGHAVACPGLRPGW